MFSTIMSKLKENLSYRLPHKERSTLDDLDDKVDLNREQEVGKEQADLVAEVRRVLHSALQVFLIKSCH